MPACLDLRFWQWFLVYCYQEAVRCFLARSVVPNNTEPTNKKESNMKSSDLFRFTCLLFGLALLTSCQKEDPVPSQPDNPTIKKTPLEVIWQTTPTDDLWLQVIGIYQNKVLYGSGNYSTGQTLVLADGRTGETVWEKPIKIPPSYRNIPVVYGNFLYYKEYLGSRIYRVPLDNTGPAVEFVMVPGYTTPYFHFYGSSAVVQYLDGYSYSDYEKIALVDTLTGSLDVIMAIQRPANFPPTILITDIPQIWNLPNGDTILTVLKMDGIPNYKLLSRNLSTGDTLYNITINESNPIVFSPERFLVYDGRIFVAFEDKVHCYQSDSGVKLWSYTSSQSQSNIRLGIFASGDALVILGKTKNSAARNVATGQSLWHNDLDVFLNTAVSNPIFFNNRMFYSGAISGINLETGIDDWRFSADLITGMRYSPELNLLFGIKGDLNGIKQVVAYKYQE